MSDTKKTLLVNNLRNFIEEQKIWLQNTLNSVGWDVSDLDKLVESSDPELVSCSIDPEHRIPPDNILKHEEICEKRNGQYPEVVDSLSFELEDEKKHALLIDDIIDPNVTNDELSQSARKRKEQKESSAKCLMELLTAERDAKRRRAAHRGKRVHSNKKSYNEIVKEVISSHMETFTEGVSEEDVEPENSKTEATSKDVIQPRADCYLGVGSKCYSGNPYKRWLSIEKEEKELVEEIKNNRKENRSRKRSRHRDNSYDRHRTVEKSTYDDKHKKDYYRYEKRDKEKDYERSKYKHALNDSHSYSLKAKDKSYHSSHYDEKYKEKNTDEDNSKRKPHYDSDSNESHRKRKKKSRERSRHKSRHKSRHRDSNKE